MEDQLQEIYDEGFFDGAFVGKNYNNYNSGSDEYREYERGYQDGRWQCSPPCSVF